MYQDFFDYLPSGSVRIMEPMKNHTSFKIGGPADVMVLPESVDMLKEVIQICVSNRLPYFVFGLGSNLLVTDKGFRGIAIKIGNSFKEVKISGAKIHAQAGIRLSELSRKASAASLSGLEFAEGIPGSLGGAIFMNAGAYGSEMKDIVSRVTVMSPQGEIRSYIKDELELEYRKSRFQKSQEIIISAELTLTEGDKEEIQAQMRELAKQRREKQPLDLPSAGSTFKRPPGYYVGPLIEKMGLKGYQIGGARISEKHAGFIVNTGNATAADVINLIKFVQEKTRELYNIEIEPEIRIIGEN
ncbi:MAG: UDP-N-acetylmuramate dehydrogenase [Syntrophomonadaceae bacterium]|jgi:UDP-N-acetylmuramate dehydrogenase